MEEKKNPITENREDLKKQLLEKDSILENLLKNAPELNESTDLHAFVDTMKQWLIDILETYKDYNKLYVGVYFDTTLDENIFSSDDMDDFRSRIREVNMDAVKIVQKISDKYYYSKGKFFYLLMDENDTEENFRSKIFSNMSKDSEMVNHELDELEELYAKLKTEINGNEHAIIDSNYRALFHGTGMLTDRLSWRLSAIYAPDMPDVAHKLVDRGDIDMRKRFSELKQLVIESYEGVRRTNNMLINL